jgi:hypothetical protein
MRAARAVAFRRPSPGTDPAQISKEIASALSVGTGGAVVGRERQRLGLGRPWLERPRLKSQGLRGILRKLRSAGAPLPIRAFRALVLGLSTFVVLALSFGDCVSLFSNKSLSFRLQTSSQVAERGDSVTASVVTPSLHCGRLLPEKRAAGAVAMGCVGRLERRTVFSVSDSRGYRGAACADLDCYRSRGILQPLLRSDSLPAPPRIAPGLRDGTWGTTLSVRSCRDAKQEIQ